MGDKKQIGRYHEKRGEDYLTVYKSDDGDVVQIEQYDARSAYYKLRGVDFFTESVPGLIKLLQKAAGIKDEKVEYEYAVQRTSLNNDRLYIIGDYWGEKEERASIHKALSADESPITYTLVKRRKAGKVEDA